MSELRRWWAVAGAALLLVAGCSSGGGSPGEARAETPSPASADDGPAAMADAGDGVEAGGATEGSSIDDLALPDGVPTVVPEGGVVRFVGEPAPGTMQDKSVVRLLYPADDFDAIVEMYEGWFADEGIEVESSTREGSHRWRWYVDIDGAPSVQQVLLTVGGLYDEGGAMLRIDYDA